VAKVRTKPYSTAKARLIRKHVVPYEESSPESEPLFINNVQVSHHGQDIYVDVGVIPLDDILPGEHPGDARFLVLERLVMSTWTLVGIQHQITQILIQLAKKGIDVGQMEKEIRGLAAKSAELAISSPSASTNKPNGKR
jgi:hypothetical protein